MTSMKTGHFIQNKKDRCSRGKCVIFLNTLTVFLFFRRKPQNLTPPGSSDGGSSGSGQSPTSTHPGSPPPPVSSSKRPGYYDGADGLPTKRQRISHYRKPSEPTYRLPAENNTNQRRPVTDSRDTSNMNPRSRESPTNGFYNGMLNNDKRNLSDDEDSANRKRSCDSHSLRYEVGRHLII